MLHQQDRMENRIPGCAGLPCLLVEYGLAGELFQDSFRPVVQSVSPAGNPPSPPFGKGGLGGFGRAPRSYPSGCEPSCHWVPVGFFSLLGPQEGALPLEAQEHPFGRDLLDQVVSVHLLALDVPPTVDHDHAIRLRVGVDEDVQSHLRYRVA